MQFFLNNLMRHSKVQIKCKKNKKFDNAFAKAKHLELQPLSTLQIDIVLIKYVYKYNAIQCIFKQIGVYLESLKDKIMNRIKEVLEDKGIKQVWLAERLGKSFNTVNGYVQNRTQPSLETLYEIATILQIDAKELLVTKTSK